MPKRDPDGFYEMLYLQAQNDTNALAAFAHYGRMKDFGYDVGLKEAAAYALANEPLRRSDEEFEASIDRIASLAGILTRARHGQA